MRTVPYLQLFLTLLFASVLIGFIDGVNLLKYPKLATYYITNPMSLGIYKSSQVIGRQFHFIFAARFAAQENKALQEQIAALISENSRLRTKLSETESLLEQEKALDLKTYNLTSARPVGLDRFLRIDKGLNDGIKPNQAVVFKENFIGLTTQVSEKGSNVRLLQDPDSKVAAFALNKDGKARGVLTGQFGSEIILDKILHEEPIKEGDLVYSEGTEGTLPRGLILGSVSQVIEKQTEVFKQAKVKPIFDIRDLELVFVIQE